ncbi:pseudouridine synthase [Comamonas resistens]|uniref:Pseudouridine synthase n=1 Tax=Comamonas resistens TaxID=3046670 RepID=A0ABY8SRY7_9BURK|nr:pseudouridine synthase [Comamonas resistens]MDL5036997.1 pseudouridine synthase [Comamonas resistens]WHS65797.1 pseudouridine synthase [Comamonas resistens]
MPRPFPPSRSSSRPTATRRAGPQRQAAPRPEVTRLLCFHKPYGVLSQFTPEGKWQGLKDWIAVPGVYVAGRLDADSEGLLLLTNDGQLQARIADPRHKMEKTYWVQVEGVPADAALQRLRDGVELNDGKTLPARVRLIEPQPDMWPRNPPIRVRQNIPDCWIELIIREGRNRQVRRMTAAIGHPTLRLVRMAVGPYSIAGLEPGQWVDVSPV